jgi:hypothetical protein
MAGSVLAGRTSEPNTFGVTNDPYVSANVSGVVQGDRVTFTKTYDGTGGQTHSVQYAARVDRDHGVMVGEWSLGSARGAFTLTKEQ